MEEVRIWIGRLASEAADGIYAVGAFKFTEESVKTASVMDVVNAYNMTIMNPKLICGLFLGGMMAFVFCAMTMKAVGRAAGAMVNEVRRQFREIPGILEGTGKPDSAACVSISTKGVQKEMILPSLLALFLPLSTGLLLGAACVM